MMADIDRLTMLLSDCGLIYDRRQSSNGWYVNYGGRWIPFAHYLPSSYCDSDLLLLCTEHEMRKQIEGISYMAERIKAICYN
jgi:hypothetical protein